jgi:hypothetical protein
MPYCTYTLQLTAAATVTVLTVTALANTALAVTHC